MTEVDSTAIEPTRGTAAHYMFFLDWAQRKGELPANTVQNWRSTSTKVLEIEDDWQDLNLVALDLDAHLDRFEILKRTTYSSGSMNTYKSRMRVAIETYRRWLAKAPDWKPKGSSSTRPSRNNSKKSPGEAPLASPAQQKVEPLVGHVPTHTPLIEYQLALRPGVRAHLTLPEILTEREAQRVVRFIQGLAVAEEIGEQLVIPAGEIPAE
jgi:hypothetical protein